MKTPSFLYPSIFAFAVLAFTIAILHLIGFAMSIVDPNEGMSRLVSAAVFAAGGLLLLAVIDIRKCLEHRT